MAASIELKTRGEMRRLDEDMAELSLLLPSWQMQALEQAARSEGISMGQYVRRALRVALEQFVLPPRRN